MEIFGNIFLFRVGKFYADMNGFVVFLKCSKCLALEQQCCQVSLVKVEDGACNVKAAFWVFCQNCSAFAKRKGFDFCLCIDFFVFGQEVCAKSARCGY